MIRIISSFLLSLALIFTGCSDSAEGDAGRLDVFPVKGKITLSGSPVAGASVTFSPVDPEKTRVAYGKTNDNGEYTLTTYDAADGAAPGDYIVLVSKSAAPAATSGGSAHDQYVSGGGAPSHAGRKAATGGAVLPDRYAAATSSDLQATVTTSEDTNTFDFDLKP